MGISGEMASLWLIVGSSRGFGEKLAQLVLQRPQASLLLYSRSPLQDALKSDGVKHTQLDLSNVDTLPQVFENSLKEIKGEDYAKIYLIENSAALGPIASVRELNDYK